MAPRKLSPAARRKAAIARRFPHWSLTNEKPSRWLHIGASFRALDELSRIRSRWPFLSRHDREWLMARRVPDALRQSRFNLSLYPNRLPS